MLLTVDLLLLLFIVMLYSPAFTGVPLHEVLGILFGLPLVVHLLASWKWIVQNTIKFPQRSRNKITYLLNGLLFTLCILQVVSGLVISHFLLPFFRLHRFGDWKWRAVHNESSVAIIVVASVHIAMNWPRIISYFKRLGAHRRRTVRAFNLRRLQTAARRSMVLMMLALTIAMIALLIIGAPGRDSSIVNNDAMRLKQSFAKGSVQLAGIATALMLLVALARRLLKIRL